MQSSLVAMYSFGTCGLTSGIETHICSGLYTVPKKQSDFKYTRAVIPVVVSNRLSIVIHTL